MDCHNRFSAKCFGFAPLTAGWRMDKSVVPARRSPNMKPAIPEKQRADRTVSRCWRCAREIVGGAVISGEHAYCSIACAQSVPIRYLG